MTRAATLILACLALTACAANPKATVMQLDTTDPAWSTAECEAARHAAAGFNERQGVKTAVAVAGMVSGVPVAGALVNAAMTAAEQKERKRLNNAVAAACVSPPVVPTTVAQQ